MAEKKRTVTGGTKKVIRLGGSLVITIPPEFAHAHNIAAGDDLPYAANHLLKFIPMPEESDEELTGELLEKRELDYNEVIELNERISIPSGEDPVKAYLNGCDSLYEQMKKLYPGYMVSRVDTITITVEGKKYYQPGRITMQRIKGKVVPPVEE